MSFAVLQAPIFLPPEGNLASYRSMRGGEILPMTGELGEVRLVAISKKIVP